MKEWLTARELAAQKLPELPATERAIQVKADKDGWNSHPTHARKRSGRGGGMEYNVALLPTLAQIIYKQRHIDISRWIDVREEAIQEPQVSLSDRAETERAARMAIIQKFEQFSAGLSIGRVSQMQVFSDKYNLGTIAVDPWVKDAVPKFGKRTLSRWISAARKGNSNSLAVDRSKARKGKGILDVANSGQVRSFVLALIAHQPHLSAHHVRTICRDEFGDQIEGAKGMVNMPPIRTFQHFLKVLKEDNKVALTKLTNPDLYRSTMAPAGTGTMRHITEPNALWQIDASPVDALCVDGRYSLYACIDIATRRTVITLSKTPRASAVALMIRKAVLAWGLPDTIKTDNGSDFVARDTRRLLASLSIEMDVSDAYTPQQKGHVERVIGTFQRDVGPQLPGFVGHSVSDRKAIESRKSFAARMGESDAEIFGVQLTAAVLQSYIDRWLETVYEQRQHTGLQNRTPFAVATASTAAIRTVNERALDLLLMPAAGKGGNRTTTKFGIRIDGRYFLSPDLMPGTRVFVRQDPNDAGKVFAFLAETGVFLSEAICPELSGIHPETLVATHKKMHAEKLAEATQQIRKDMRAIAKGPTLIERTLEVAARDMPNVVALPKKTVETTTPEIAAALDAANSDLPKRSTMTASATAIHAQLMQEPIGAQKVTILPETRERRFRRALDLNARVEAGEIIEQSDAIWLGGYLETPEFKTQQVMFDDFGDQAPGLRS